MKVTDRRSSVSTEESGVDTRTEEPTQVILGDVGTAGQPINAQDVQAVDGAVGGVAQEPTGGDLHTPTVLQPEVAGLVSFINGMTASKPPRATLRKFSQGVLYDLILNNAKDFAVRLNDELTQRRKEEAANGNE